MLGHALMSEASRRGVDVTGIARQDADLCVDITDDTKLEQAIAFAAPDVIINAAALVDLKLCEVNKDLAYRTNARAVDIIANVCRSRDIQLVHISTDHFFSGDGTHPHAEDDEVMLVNEYARTKFAGESFALSAPGTLVVRTNITGFRGDANRPTFAEWMFNSLTKGEQINAFFDSYTSTIDVRSFASALFDLIPKQIDGILNLASCEVVDKKTFIEAAAACLHIRDTNIRDASIATLYPKRGDSLGLDVTRAETLLDKKLPNLQEVVSTLTEEYKRSS